MSNPDGSAFLAGMARWVDMLGQLREVVRQELVAAQLAEVMSRRGLRRARVLDVGCGQGSQALRLARAGHEVTGLDISAELLARFDAALSAEPADVRARVRLLHGPGEAAPELAPGPFDLVACHGVLMYLEDLTPTLDALCRVAAEHATLSLLVRNGLATAMREGLCGNWRQALVAFERRDYVNRLGVPARAHTPEELDRVLAPRGWQRDRWYGVRVFCDHRDGEAPAPEALARLLAAEHEAARRDPYRQVAGLLHVLYARVRDARVRDARVRDARVRDARVCDARVCDARGL